MEMSSPSRPRVKNHLVTVIDMVDFTPWYRRIHMDPCGLFEFYDPQPGTHLLFEFPDGNRTHTRAYSIGGVDSTGFWCEFVLHGGAGPGATWASQAVPGSTIHVSEPPYTLVIPDVQQALLIADPTAWAAARSLLTALTTTMPVTMLLVDDHREHDQIPMHPLDGHATTNPVTSTWVDRIDVDALREVTAGFDQQDCFVWAAGERGLAKTVKDYLRAQFRVPAHHLHVQTYWIARPDTLTAV